MKVSEVTIEDLKEYANVYHNEDDKLFNNILVACKSYIKNYTGLDDTKMDSKEDLTMALLVLSNEFYDNRIYSVQDSNSNKVVNSILDMYSINLL